MKKVLPKTGKTANIRQNHSKNRWSSIKDSGASTSAVVEGKTQVASPVRNSGGLANTSEFFYLKQISGYTDEYLAGLLGITPRTIRTKRGKGDNFDISQTERLRKLIQLFVEGTQVFGNVEAFNEWLEKPAYGLDYAFPNELLKKPGGLEQVLQELVSIKYGDTL